MNTEDRPATRWDPRDTDPLTVLGTENRATAARLSVAAQFRSRSQRRPGLFTTLVRVWRWLWR